MIKRVILMILAILLLALLVACGSNDANSDLVDSIDITNLPDTVNVETVASIKESPDVFVIDVREQWEYDEGHIPGVTLIPMGEVSSRLSEIPTDQEVIVTCRSGNRSGQITDYLREQGYDNVHNMAGGILAWEEAGFTVER